MRIEVEQRLKSWPEPPELGEPPDIIREWAERVIAGWGLTGRERDVLDIMLKGCSDNEIAEALHMSSKAVKHHLYAIRKKSKTESRAEIFAEILRL